MNEWENVTCPSCKSYDIEITTTCYYYENDDDAPKYMLAKITCYRCEGEMVLTMWELQRLNEEPTK